MSVIANIFSGIALAVAYVLITGMALCSLTIVGAVIYASVLIMA
jgi:hypothetical protein